MDCDQVFIVLTRGPFPTGESWDEEVESHLEVCSDCWRLAEALRPALEIFQEAVPPSEGRDLPGYWGDARPASAVVTEISRRTRRLSTAAGPLREYPLRGMGLSPQLSHELSSGIIRVTALAATVAVAALVIASIFKG